MVQILHARQQQPSIGQRLAQGVGRGLEMGSEMYDQYQAKKLQEQQQQQRNQSIQALTGMDLSGVDPDTQKVIVQSLMQGGNQRDLEMLKQKGKQGMIEQKQSFLNRLLGGNGQQQGQSQEQELPQQQNENQSPQGFDASQLTDEQIAQASAMDPNLGRELRYAKDSSLKEKRHKEDVLERKQAIGRKEAFEITKPIMQEMTQVRKNIPLQEQAIEDIISASPHVSALDYFADVTGFEPLRSAEGVKLKTGIKDFFLSDLTRVGARPNQWIEQQLADALPKIGRSKEANLITAEGLKFKVSLAKQRMETIDRFAEEDREKYGFIRADIDSRASKSMKKYVADRQKELKENIEKIKKENNGKKEVVIMRSPDGSTYEIDSNDIDEATKHGFEFTEKT